MENSWLGLEGKTVIVTGAASGIGKSVAQEYLNNGSNVVVCDMNPNAPEFNISETSGKYIYVVTDVTNSESINNMIKKAKEAFGEIHILVNNAGINIPRLLVDPVDSFGKYELKDSDFDKLVNVNFKGVYLCAQAVAREMLLNTPLDDSPDLGVIVNMSSESGLEGSEGQSIYAATKNAVNSLTRSWAKEIGKLGIRVVGVAPGILEATGLRTIEYETALAYTRGITVEELRKGYSKTSTTPLGRSGKLSEVADLVCYISSKKASYIHGATYNVAGGKTRG